MFRVSWLAAAIMINFFMHANAGAQTLEVKRYNYAEWTRAVSLKWLPSSARGKWSF